MARGKKNVVDFEELQRERQGRMRRRRVFRLIKLMLLVIAVLLMLGAIDYVANYDFGVGIGDTFASFGGPGYPVPVPGGLIRDVRGMGSNLVVLNDTNVQVYNRSGRLLSNFQHLSDRTAVLTSRDRMLVYEYGGRRVSIHSASRELQVHVVEDMVLGAALGAGGEYAIITSPRTHIAQVEVFNSRFESMIRWGSPQHVRGVAISPRGDMMVADVVDSFGGVLGAELVFIRFGMREELLRVRLEGELVVHLSFISDNRIAVLTDRAYRVFDNSGRMVGQYRLPAGMPLTAFQSDGDRMLVLCGAREARVRELILLDSSARRTASAEIPGRVRSMALAGRNVWVLTDAGLMRYNLSLDYIETAEGAGIQRIQYVDGRLYYFTRYEIRILEG